MIRQTLKGLCAIIVIFVLAASSLFAQTDNVLEEISPPPLTSDQTMDNPVGGTEGLSGMVLPSLTRIALSLMAIIGIIYGSVFLLRKLTGHRLGSGGHKGAIQLVEKTFLAPKKSVCLLKLADRAVLIGVTETNINLLTEFDWSELPQQTFAKPKGQPIKFQRMLNQAAGRLFNSRNRKEAGNESTV